MILYHYTTAIGLQGIIQDRAIWASDYRFTNDAKEFLHGLEIFQEVLKSYRPTPRMSEIVDIIRDYKPRLDFCVLLASFCIDPDLLSQWRGYNGGAGYALGIDGDWLEQNAQKQGFHLVPVSYVPEEKRVALQKLELYPVHVMTRKSFGLMTRKLSVTESQRSAQFPGTFSRRKLSVASANCAQVA